MGPLKDVTNTLEPDTIQIDIEIVKVSAMRIPRKNKSCKKKQNLAKDEKALLPLNKPVIKNSLTPGLNLYKLGAAERVPPLPQSTEELLCKAVNTLLISPNTSTPSTSGASINSNLYKSISIANSKLPSTTHQNLNKCIQNGFKKNSSTTPINQVSNLSNKFTTNTLGTIPYSTAQPSVHTTLPSKEVSANSIVYTSVQPKTVVSNTSANEIKSPSKPQNSKVKSPKKKSPVKQWNVKPKSNTIGPHKSYKDDDILIADEGCLPEQEEQLVPCPCQRHQTSRNSQPAPNGGRDCVFCSSRRCDACGIEFHSIVELSNHLAVHIVEGLHAAQWLGEALRLISENSNSENISRNENRNDSLGL